ncbi:MAG: hypothetical protein LAT75_14975, partial [Candidatus Cyclonatronum sp.]|nr:hypothetical protein [Cyclonatronum sp.]
MSDSAFSACYLYALCRDTAQTGNRYLNKSGLICLTLLLVLITLPAAQLSAADPLYAGGSGTAEDPYLIETEAQFLDIAANSGAHFLLLNNITVTQRTGANLTGVFNGGGHNIHVSVNAGDVTNSGLFSSLSGSGTVRNVTFTGTYNTGSGDNSGLVAGNMSGSSLIEDVISRVNFTKSGSGGNTGGIVGSMSGGTIIRTVSTGNTVGNVTVGGITGFGTGGLIEQSLNTGNVHATGGNGSGGITGGSQAGTVRDSYSTGAVTGSISCGGAFGYITNAAVIERVYSAGAANCSVTSSGGFVGQRAGGTVSHVFYDLNRSILFTDPVAQGLSGARMRMASFFTGFDFDDIWQMHPDFPSYPLLRSLSYNEPFSSPAVLPIPGLLEEPMFASGTGTAEDPFVITSGAHVQNIGHNSSTHYLLANDVLVSQRTNIPFAGVLEGSGNTITLNFNLGNVNETGLFRRIRGNGTVRNLIIDGSITQSGGSFTGSVAADMFNTSLLYRVISRVEINAGSTSVIGGLVARLYEGTIRESAFMGSISAPSGGTIGGLAAQINWSGSLIERSFNTGTLTAQSNGGWVGGIAATMNAGTVLDSFSTGTISAFANCGGAFAAVTSTISPITVTRVYAAGLVNCDGWNTGGLVGQSNATVSASFYDIEATGKTSSAGGTGLTGEDMRTRVPFENAGWSLVGEGAIWGVSEGIFASYPFLKWFDYDSQLDLPGYFSPFAGGEGTAEAPYQISEQSHFLAIPNEPPYYYILMNDISLTAVTGVNFTGVFDGNGKTIDVNISISNTDYVGLFRSLGGSARVRDLRFTGTMSLHNALFAGLIAPDMSGSSRIENVISKVNLTNTGTRNDAWNGSGTGGLIARHTDGVIIRSAVLGNTTGYLNVGGISSRTWGGSIEESFNAGTVTASGNNGAGGLTADLRATVSDSYNTGRVNASSNCGGAVGAMSLASSLLRIYSSGFVNCTGSFSGGLVGQRSSGSVNHSFWDTQTSGQSTSAGGTGLTTAQMRTRAHFVEAGWVFEGENAPWNTLSVFQSYPFLRAFTYDNVFDPPETPVFPVPGLFNPFAGGFGSEASPFLISEEAHFMSIVGDAGFFYLLQNDITVTQMTGLAFRGDFDGGGNNIHVDIDAGIGQNAGLFRILHSGKVRNLRLSGHLRALNPQFTGLIAAEAFGNARIQNVHSSAWVEVTGTLQGYATGGLTGRMTNSWIQNSSVTGRTEGIQNVGGLAGLVEASSLIERSYNTGTIIASLEIAGGLTGRLAGGTVRDSYSTGAIQSSYYCGGAIGFSQFTNLVERIFATGFIDCILLPMVPPSGGLIAIDNNNSTVVNSSYFDADAAGIGWSVGGGEARTSAQMRSGATFAGWDFEDTWQ